MGAMIPTVTSASAHTAYVALGANLGDRAANISAALDALGGTPGTRVILDGHHRWNAAARLGFVQMPCYSVRYLDDPTIRVMSRRPDIDVTKQSVIDTALAGRTYPHKTTRHMYDLPEWVEPVPLDRLVDA